MWMNKSLLCLLVIVEKDFDRSGLKYLFIFSSPDALVSELLTSTRTELEKQHCAKRNRISAE